MLPPGGEWDSVTVKSVDWVNLEFSGRAMVEKIGGGGGVESRQFTFTLMLREDVLPWNTTWRFDKCRGVEPCDSVVLIEMLKRHDHDFDRLLFNTSSDAYPPGLIKRDWSRDFLGFGKDGTEELGEAMKSLPADAPGNVQRIDGTKDEDLDLEEDLDEVRASVVCRRRARVEERPSALEEGRGCGASRRGCGRVMSAGL